LRIRPGGRGVRRTLTVAGEIDVATAGRLRRAVLDVLSEEPAELVFDLRDVTYLDSSGMGVLLGAHRSLSDRGGAVSVVSSHPAVCRALQLTRLDATLRLQSELPDLEGHASGESPQSSAPV